MDISVNWLRALAPSIEGSADELAAALSARAVPVDKVDLVGEELDDVVVARGNAARVPCDDGSREGDRRPRGARSDRGRLRE